VGEHVLVTGGAGFVGSHLVDALLAQGHQVRVLDSLEPQVHGPSGGALAYLHSHAEMVRGSVTDAATVARALEWVDVVFHGAPLEPLPTTATKPLQPTSVYAVTKRDHEELFLNVAYAYRIPTVALRYFNIYGERQALSNPYTGIAAIFSARVLNSKPPLIFEDGLQSRDFIHVSDIVAANLLALATDRADYQALNVGTGRATTVREVADLIVAVLGKPELKPEVMCTFREGDIRHCYADITLARRLLGFGPKVAFSQGIHQLLAWVSSQPAEDRFEEAHQQLTTRGLA